MALYLGDTKLTGTGVQVDDALSSSSTNPVENKAVTGALADVGYIEWQKPADWVDIRSGALNNSIYLLVGHSADYTTYPKVAFNATVSSSGTYDVFVDGVKKATTASATTTTLDWQTLALTTGFDTTHPTALRTHIVRITPSQTTDTLTVFQIASISGQTEQGVLWMHFQLSNAIKIRTLAASGTTIRNFLLEAVTAKNNKITYTVSSNNAQSGFYGSFNRCTSLVQIPVLEAENATYSSGVYLSFREVPAKKVIIKNNNGTEKMSFMYNTQVQEFDIENGVNFESGTTSDSTATGLTKLRKFPALNPAGETLIASGLVSLENTVIDDSPNSSRTLLRVYGSSSNPVSGLKGLTVSSAAPFTGSSPQINVSYTGLDRTALIALFNSMPTVSASQVCNITGCTGADDLTASDLAIATNKGWSITR